MDLTNKVIIVTGGASGIGRATALMMGKSGAKVVVSDINTVHGEETTHDICTAGGDALFVKTDTVNAHQVEALVEAAVDKYGKLDAAFNNAGVGGKMARLHEQTEDIWDHVMDVNARGVWLCLKYQIPLMLENGGVIVNMASAAGLVGSPYNGIYSASKHAVIGLTRSAAQEYARYNIRVNAICPGFTDTPMVAGMDDFRPGTVKSVINSIPLRRLGTPDEIASAVTWLCSDGAAFVTGATLSVDGGIVSG